LQFGDGWDGREIMISIFRMMRGYKNVALQPICLLESFMEQYSQNCKKCILRIDYKVQLKEGDYL